MDAGVAKVFAHGLPLRGKPAVAAPQTPFSEALRDAARKVQDGGLRFSTHALDRLSRRNVALSEAVQQRLTSGVSSLAAKGSKEGLVVVGENRFLVSVANRTVITAMGAGERDVYTNIDGVAFA